jgi:hypothetical protein
MIYKVKKYLKILYYILIFLYKSTKIYYFFFIITISFIYFIYIMNTFYAFLLDFILLLL